VWFCQCYLHIYPKPTLLPVCYFLYTAQALYARHGFVTYEAFRVTKKAPPVFLMKRAPAAPASAAAAVVVVGSDAAVTPVIIPDKIAAAAVLSPVFSIRAIAVGSNGGGSIDRSSSAGSDRIAAAVVAKEGANSQVTPPASPLIAVGREGCVAVEDHLLLPLAAVSLVPAAGSNGLWGRPSSCSPADAQVIIRSASNASLAKDVTSDPQAAAAAAAMAPAAATAGSTDASRNLGESPVEYGVQQDEAGCDSSSRAGAGGPSDAAAAGC
jgi:hypothetical protein